MARNSLPNLSALSLRQEPTGSSPRVNGYEIVNMTYLMIKQRPDQRPQSPSVWDVKIALAIKVRKSDGLTIDNSGVTMEFLVTDNGDKNNRFTATQPRVQANVRFDSRVTFSDGAWPILLSQSLHKLKKALGGVDIAQAFHQAILVAMGMPVNLDATFNGTEIANLQYLRIETLQPREGVVPTWFVTLDLVLYTFTADSVRMEFTVRSVVSQKERFTATLASSTATRMNFSKDAWLFLEKYPPPRSMLLLPESVLGTNQDFHRAILVAMGMPAEDDATRILKGVGLM